MYEIIPGILEKEWHDIEKKIALVKPFARTLHIDLLDGKFAPNTTWMDPKPFAKYKDDFFLELHMMVEEPISYIDAFAQAGFQRFIGQIEMMSDQVAFVAKAEQVGEVGLALDGPTPLENVKVSLRDLDMLLIMTITAGFSGKPFQPALLKKVEEVLSHDALQIVGVDGGMNPETILQARKAGASRFVCTSSLFTHDDPEKAYKTLATLLADSTTA